MMLRMMMGDEAQSSLMNLLSLDWTDPAESDHSENLITSTISK